MMMLLAINVSPNLQIIENPDKIIQFPIEILNNIEIEQKYLIEKKVIPWYLLSIWKSSALSEGFTNCRILATNLPDAWIMEFVTWVNIIRTLKCRIRAGSWHCWSCSNNFSLCWLTTRRSFFLSIFLMIMEHVFKAFSTANMNSSSDVLLRLLFNSRNDDLYVPPMNRITFIIIGVFKDPSIYPRIYCILEGYLPHSDIILFRWSEFILDPCFKSMWHSWAINSVNSLQISLPILFKRYLLKSNWILAGKFYKTNG